MPEAERRLPDYADNPNRVLADDLHRHGICRHSSEVGIGFHLRPHVGRVRVRRAYPRRVLPPGHASMGKMADLVTIPLRMALWQRERDGHPVISGEMIHHSGCVR